MSAPDAPVAPVAYRVGLAARERHLFEVEARFPIADVPREAGGAVELLLPVWTPGSYMIREHEKNLQDLECSDEAGRSLGARKIAKARWRVEVGEARTLVARYRVYAHELTVRTSHLDETHAYWNGTALYLYVDALRGRAAHVTIADVPAGWRADTGLARDAAAPFVLRAADYDELVDCPVEVGAHERIDFTAAGRAHVAAVWGRPLWGARKVTDDLVAIIAEQAKMFGGALPPDPAGADGRYTFILHFAPGAYGGLEHKNSSTCLGSPFAFASDDKYGDWLELLSHEYFHSWNGKRIRPAALGPFDYQNENYTRSLWVVEGLTSYYDRLMVRRAGRLSAAKWREKLAEDLTKLARIPGRKRQSLEESSFDAWIKLYRPDENTVNSTVSYYLKGGVVAMMFDLEIRRRSAGARSLDDVMRLLWRGFLADGRGYADDAVQALFEEAAGCSLDDLFAQAVRGRGDLDIDGPLASVGLAVKRGSGGDDDEKERVWLGVNTSSTSGRLRVTEVLEGGPAELANLYPGDEIVALDGFRADEAGLGDRLATRRAGETMKLTLFRRDELRETTVTLARRPADKIEIVADKGATEAARAAYAAWLGEAWTADDDE